MILYPEDVQQIKTKQELEEKVLRKRSSKEGHPELLVKLKGWPAKFNTWVPATDLERLK